MRLLNTITAAIAALWVAVAWAAVAWAGPAPTPPLATYSTTISGEFGATEVPSTVGGSGVAYANYGSATGVTAQVLLTPDPTVSITGGVPFDSGLTVQAIAVWYVEPTGTAVGDVPVDVAFNALVSTHQPAPCTFFCPGYNWVGGVSLGYGPEGSYNTIIYDCVQSNYFSCNGGSESLQFEVPDNTVDFIQIVAGGNIGQGTFMASIDPTVHIDQTYLTSHPGETLAISSNVGNGAVSGAPEPAAWGLLMVGIGVAGGALRRRRRTSGAVNILN